MTDHLEGLENDMEEMFTAYAEERAAKADLQKEKALELKVWREDVVKLLRQLVAEAKETNQHLGILSRRAP